MGGTNYSNVKFKLKFKSERERQKQKKNSDIEVKLKLKMTETIHQQVLNQASLDTEGELLHQRPEDITTLWHHQ